MESYGIPEILHQETSDWSRSEEGLKYHFRVSRVSDDAFVFKICDTVIAAQARPLQWINTVSRTSNRSCSMFLRFCSIKHLVMSESSFRERESNCHGSPCFLSFCGGMPQKKSKSATSHVQPEWYNANKPTYILYSHLICWSKWIDYASYTFIKYMFVCSHIYRYKSPLTWTCELHSKGSRTAWRIALSLCRPLAEWVTKCIGDLSLGIYR